MNDRKLVANIIDQIKEAQIKLGFAKETIRLYFPLASINAILGTEFEDCKKMLEALQDSNELNHAEIGPLHFAIHAGRIEVRVSPEGAEYVHHNVPEPRFLIAIIQLFQGKHDLTIEEICELFGEFSSAYECEKMDPETDFDYGIHFIDTTIDPYYYCIKMEMGHTIYHRFTKEDYDLLIE